jgi:glycerol-3-phosphate acyltransferase PlsX
VEGSPVVVVDVGANVDCSPRMLAQFAVMGEMYSRIILRRPNPRVGLLSIGEEEHKGNDLTRAAMPLLKGLNLNFIGNVEGGDIYGGKVDVIVCDGFIGNVALKVSEGLGEMVKYLLQKSLEATITGKIGYAIAKAAFTDFKKRVDYSEYGGAALLGVRGMCIICHGRSNANAIKNAIDGDSRGVERSVLYYYTLKPSQPATILWGGPPGPRSTPWSTCSNTGRAGPGGPARTRASAPRSVAALPLCGAG